MESVTTEQLQSKKTELKAEFDRNKKAVVGIDNLIEKLQNQRAGHVDAMIRTQGAFKVIQELLGEEEANNNINDTQHGDTVQSQEG